MELPDEVVEDILLGRVLRWIREKHDNPQREIIGITDIHAAWAVDHLTDKRTCVVWIRSMGPNETVLTKAAIKAREPFTLESLKPHFEAGRPT